MSVIKLIMVFEIFYLMNSELFKHDICLIFMWVAKFKINGENSVIGSRAKKFGVSLSGYPISVHRRKDASYISFVAFIFGEEDKVNNFKKELAKDEKIISLEGKDNFIICQIKEDLKFWPAVQDKIIHIKPVVVEESGLEYWTLGSHDKKELCKFIDVYEKTHHGELLKISEEEITNFSVISIQPKLTFKQKNAIEMAIKKGYYHYPRKTDVKELAKDLGLSYSTYQAHLRKAEMKLLPFFFGKSG